MKNTLKSILLLGLIVLTSCSRGSEVQDSNSNTIKEDNPNLGFSVFQYTNLYKAIGMNEDEFKKKLEAEKIEVSFNEDDFEYSYYAKNENAPYQNYWIKFKDDNVIDYTTKPAPTRYGGLARIVMIPVDENKLPVKIEVKDVDKIHRYFYQKANPLEPTKKPYEYLLHNRFASVKGYFEYLNDLEFFLTELKNPKKEVHGRITWNNNFESKIMGDAANASAEKNTHIQQIHYDFKKKTVQIEIEVNLPTDFWRLKQR
ncbi:MAG: hypothetical protein KBA33_08605 [Cloacibacterium sp.]|nr:hypothetical protein [Cloacibacterium sp.]